MTETLNGRQGELMTEREVLERYSKDQLVDLILAHGEKVGEIERTMNLAADVLQGYGTSVEEELEKREARNETKT
jgi:hypothetical protein